MNPKKPGRPSALGEMGSRLSMWIQASQHDRLSKIAHERGASVSQVAREMLTHFLTTRAAGQK